MTRNNIGNIELLIASDNYNDFMVTLGVLKQSIDNSGKNSNSGSSNNNSPSVIINPNLIKPENSNNSNKNNNSNNESISDKIANNTAINNALETVNNKAKV